MSSIMKVRLGRVHWEEGVRVSISLPDSSWGMREKRKRHKFDGR